MPVVTSTSCTRRDDGADGELPAEAQHHVDEHEDQREQQREAGVLEQLLADLRADGLEAPRIVDVRVLRTQHVEHSILHGRDGLGVAGVLAVGRRQADQHLGAEPKFCTCADSKPASVSSAANRVELGRLRVADLDEDAAREVEAVVEPGIESPRRSRAATAATMSPSPRGGTSRN